LGNVLPEAGNANLLIGVFVFWTLQVGLSPLYSAPVNQAAFCAISAQTSSLESMLTKLPANVDSKEFTEILSLLNATLTKKRGRECQRKPATRAGAFAWNTKQFVPTKRTLELFDPPGISREHGKFARGAKLDLGLQGRIAIVAAASKGLGRAVSEELAREGASVAICARNASELEQAAAHIHKSTGREVFHQAVDVTNPAAVSHFVGAVEGRFGRIDICVTNSGGPPSKMFVDTNPEDWRAAVDLLLMSTVFFAKESLPRMQKNKWGRFITITSSAVKQPVDGLLLSNSIRAAVTGLARTLANEYAAHGITVNNVCPGYTRTARLDNLAASISARTGTKPEAVFGDWTRQIPAARIGTPQEFAAVVAFLASERASYVNGASIAVDGGLVRSLF